MKQDWREPRQEIRDGKVVFFPRLTPQNVWSILATDRKKGLNFVVKKVVYSQALGSVAWRIDEDGRE